MKFQSLNELQIFLDKSLNRKSEPIYKISFETEPDKSITTLKIEKSNESNLLSYERDYEFSLKKDISKFQDFEINELLFDVHATILSYSLRMNKQNVLNLWESISDEHFAFYDDMLEPSYWNDVVNLVSSEFLQQYSNLNNESSLINQIYPEPFFVDCKCTLDNQDNITEVSLHIKGNNAEGIECDVIEPIVMKYENSIQKSLSDNNINGFALSSIDKEVLTPALEHLKSNLNEVLQNTLVPDSLKQKNKKNTLK